MSFLNIENVDEEEVSLSTEGITATKELLADIKTTGLVSRNAVLSLEEFLNTRIITKKYNVKKLTSTPTPTLTEEVCYELEEAISRSDLNTLITHDNIMRKYSETIYGIKELKDVIYRTKDSRYDERKDRLLNEKYALFWDSSVLVDIADNELIKVLKYQHNYIVNALGDIAAGRVNERYRNVETAMFTGITILSDVKTIEAFMYKPQIVEPKMPNIKMVMEVINNDAIFNKLEELYKHVVNKFNNIKDGYSVRDNEDLNYEYKYISNISELLLDKDTMFMLHLLT